jgi:hypothetical protein
LARDIDPCKKNLTHRKESFFENLFNGLEIELNSVDLSDRPKSQEKLVSWILVVIQNLTL